MTRQLDTDKEYLHLKKQAGTFVQSVDAAIKGMWEAARKNKEAAANAFVDQQQNNKPVRINADMTLPFTTDLNDDYLQSMVDAHKITVDQMDNGQYHATTDNYDGAPDAGPQIEGFGWSKKAAILDCIESLDESK